MHHDFLRQREYKAMAVCVRSERHLYEAVTGHNDSLVIVRNAVKAGAK